MSMRRNVGIRATGSAIFRQDGTDDLSDLLLAGCPWMNWGIAPLPRAQSIEGLFGNAAERSIGLEDEKA
jgi:hypothetical protein